MASTRNRRALVIEVAAAVLLMSAGAVVWKVSHSGSAAATLPRPVVRELPPAPVVPEPAAAPQAPASAPSNPQVPSAGSRDRRRLPARNTPSRAFRPPAADATPPGGSPALPDPGTVALAGDRNASVLAAQIGKPVSAPAPPPRPVPNATPRTGGNFQEPKFIGGPAPVLPPLVMERGITGMVELEATVDKRGTVTHVTVRKGNPLLAPAARDAVLKRRYQPATLNGQPIEIKIPIKVVFEAGRR